MKFKNGDFQKIADDFKRISEAFTVLKDSKYKNSDLFDVVMDLTSRELDRLYLDLVQIQENSDDV